MMANNAYISLEVLTDDLCKLWYLLRHKVLNLPHSSVRSHLLSEVTNIIELRNIGDLYYLYSKISIVIDIVIQRKLGKEILELSETVKDIVKLLLKYASYVKDNYGESLESFELNCGDLPL